MARIGDDWLRSVFFLYPNRAAAERIGAAGGTGFFARWPITQHHSMLYGITASHVVAHRPNPVIAVNGQDGNRRLIETTATAWVHHRNGDDAAAFSVGPMPNRTRYHSVDITSEAVTPATIEAHDIGPGDDAFLVGRFASVEGRARNNPVVRFGHIAMNPGEPIPQEQRNFQQISFLVDCNSRGGFSGSPVFVSVPEEPGYNPHTFMTDEELSRKPYKRAVWNPNGGWRPSGTWLLGLDWGSIYDAETVGGRDQSGANIRVDVNFNTGMVGVVPAWTLLELLNDANFQQGRREAVAHLTAGSPDVGRG